MQGTNVVTDLKLTRFRGVLTAMAEDPIRSSDPANWLAEHGDALFRYALIQVSDRDISEDLVQETLLAAMKSYSSYAGNASLRTWLIGILRHKIIDEVRKRRRREVQIENPSGNLDDFDSKGKWTSPPRHGELVPADLTERREFWALFDRCHKRLPPHLAEAFLLRELESLALADICSILRISATNLSVRLHRARLALRMCLEENWFSVNQ